MFTTHFLVLLKAQQLSATSSNRILDKLYIATASRLGGRCCFIATFYHSHLTILFPMFLQESNERRRKHGKQGVQGKHRKCIGERSRFDVVDEVVRSF